MNLFVTGWGLDTDQCQSANAALDHTARWYPSLENGGRFNWQSECNSVVFACRYPPADKLESRNYVSSSDRAVVAYDGLPVDDGDRFTAHDAGELAKNWDGAARKLDGYFCGVRIHKGELQLEVQSDSFGVYPVFYWTNGTAWLVSNSVALIDQITGQHELDASGVGRYLVMGWVAGDRTLREGVRVLPAGERWTWNKDQTGPARKQTMPRGHFAHKAKSRLTQSDVEGLAADMARPLQSLSRNFEDILCPLTGGKDSRVLAALLAGNDIDARYYTYGNKIGRDAQIASEVASALNVDHESLVTESFDLSDNWDGLAKRYVMQADGMCPLQLIMGAVTAQEVSGRSIPVRIWGAGGELARAPYFNPVHDFLGATVRYAQDDIARRWIDGANGLMSPDACAEARSFVDNTIAEYADDGFVPSDLNDVFFLYERAGRRSGKNMRATMEMRDSYSPYYCRSFAEATFSLDARTRRTEPLHYRLIEAVAPEVLGIPFDKGSWSSRSPSLHLYTEVTQQLRRRLKMRVGRRLPWKKREANRHMIVKDTMFERVKWLKQVQQKLREMSLDKSSSMLWDLVDRDRFESITDPSAPESGLSANARALFLIATISCYESYSGDTGSGSNGP